MGAAASVRIAWTGRTPGTRYFGVIEYGENTAVRGRTLVTINS